MLTNASFAKKYFFKRNPLEPLRKGITLKAGGFIFLKGLTMFTW